MSVIVNYGVFMTFYPACLSLILELSRAGANGQPVWHDKTFLMRALQEEDQKPNPVVQRVKIIMSAGLMLVHAHSHWTLASEDGETYPPDLAVPEQMIPTNGTDDAPVPGYIIKWLTLSSPHIVILIIFLMLALDSLLRQRKKFIVFGDQEEIAEHIRMTDQGERVTSFAPHEPVQTPVLDSLLRQRFAPEAMQLRFAEMSTEETRKTRPIMEQSKGEGSDETDEDWLEMNSSRLPRIIKTEDKIVQTDQIMRTISETNESEIKEQESETNRSVEECLNIYREDGDTQKLTDEEVKSLVRAGHIPAYQLEKACADLVRGVRVRRKLIGTTAGLESALNKLPYTNYDYSLVMGACCENVVGYMPVPVGIAGPIRLDDKDVWVPMATTEGCLVASTTRGSRALYKCGITSRIVKDGMTRAPVVRFPSLDRASEAMTWIDNPENFEKIKIAFNSTSRFAQLKKIHVFISGRYLYIRFVAGTGDAMGMNMVSKGSEASLKMIQNVFSDMEVLSLSGNVCTDKKAAAINWVEGRGKSVVCEAIVPQAIVKNVLKTSVHKLVDTNIHKNFLGSAIAGTLGGCNAHAANIVTAIFIATGQDPAQNVSSSNCITLMEPWGENGEDLYVSCTMPSIEIGTVGGGTVLSSQGACLEMLGVRGANSECPGENACQLARIVCATVLAGELSLMSALTAGHLVQSHLKLNRSSTNVASSVVARKISTSNHLAVKDCRGPIP